MGTRWTLDLVLVHVAVIFLTVSITVLLFNYRRGLEFPTHLTPWHVLAFILSSLPLLSLPWAFLNLLGLVTDPLRLPRLEFEAPTRGFSAPFLCFRVVTRGMYPGLVAENLKRNLQTCHKVGLENFMFEVVTDRAINLPQKQGTREIVVPQYYAPPNGAKFKARALQYCLEPETNVLNDQDWIVHLDEETILTDNAVKGVFNFAASRKYHFGQGVITYTQLGIQNLILTLVDSIRVGVDYGIIRFQFTRFHLPVFSMKGSFVVSNAGAERQVTWDWGEEGSIAEDAFFAMAAASKGFQFGFIPAEMWESSPFTFADYLKQRRRWLKGLQLLLWTRRIPRYVKGGIAFNVIAWTLMPLTTLGILLARFFPVPFPAVDVARDFLTVNFFLMAVVGTAMSFNARRIGWIKYLGYCVLTVACFPVAVVGDNLASILTLFERRKQFDIVRKETIQHTYSV